MPTTDSGITADASTDDASADDANTPDVGLADSATDANLCGAIDRVSPYVLYQSADDSNSMASPVIARSLLRAGLQVPKGLIRTYEFLNYYNTQYETPAAGHVNIVPELTLEQDGTYTLQVGVQSAPLPTRRPMVITFVVDNSGSMEGKPIARERAIVRTIAASMRQGDVVNMVAWNTSQNIILDNVTVTGPNDVRVIDAANQLAADGGTDLHSGLVTGYALAHKSYAKEKMNRVVLISDGQANVGVTDATLIANESHTADGEGIYLAGVGVGNGYDDTLMDTVTDKGRGAYVFIDSDEEVVKMFGVRFDEVFEVAMRDVRLELTLPGYFRLQSTSAEQTSTVASEVDPQYLAPNDALIFNNTLRPCDPAAVLGTDAIGAKVTYSLPFTDFAGYDAVGITIADASRVPSAAFRKGQAIVAYAKALTAFSGTLTTDGPMLDALDAKLTTAKDMSPTDPDLLEIASLTSTLRALSH